MKFTNLSNQLSGRLASKDKAFLLFEIAYEAHPTHRLIQVTNNTATLLIIFFSAIKNAEIKTRKGNFSFKFN